MSPSLLASLDPRTTWYVARASGLVAWLLVDASLAAGLVMAGRRRRRGPSPAWRLDMHRFLGGMAVVFTAVHVGALLLDRVVPFRWVDVLVPYSSRWRPGAVALGVVSLYLLVTVEVTSLLMRHLPRRWWRRVHLSSFGLAAMASLHAFLAGSDAAHPAVRWASLAAAAVTAALLGLRLRARSRPDRARRPVRAAAAPAPAGYSARP